MTESLKNAVDVFLEIKRLKKRLEELKPQLKIYLSELSGEEKEQFGAITFNILEKGRKYKRNVI
jgi:hypothetical protein